MADKPIIFSAPMVRALLDGRKSMTRRLAWQRVARGDHPDGALVYTQWNKVRPGDLLWVRENFYLTDDGDSEYAVYAADPGAAEKHLAEIDALGPSFPQDVAALHRKLRPSIHMPRWASRLTLRVTGAKIEKLQEISEADAKAEGVARDAESCDHHRRTCEEIGCLGPTHRASFCELWEALHGRGAWRANPEVVALSFVVEKRNVDQERE